MYNKKLNLHPVYPIRSHTSTTDAIISYNLISNMTFKLFVLSSAVRQELRALVHITLILKLNLIDLVLQEYYNRKKKI